MRTWAVSLCVVLAVAAPVRAQSDRYSTPPHTEGPLVAAPLGPECAEDEVWAPKTTDGRRWTCEWHYSLSPAAENDPANDYVAAWVQIDADPPTGWCLAEITLTYDFKEAEVLSVTRNGSASYRKPRRVQERLEVDAGGEAEEPAAIHTQTVAGPGRVRVAMSEHSLSYRWRGRASKPVSVVLGYQLRVPTTLPVYESLSTRDVAVARC